MSTKKNKLLENAQKNIQKGQYGRAIEEYEEIIKLDPGDIRHKQKLAELLAKANRKDEAVKSYISLANHYLESVHYLKAIAVYKQIQKLEPSNPEFSLTLASLNEKQGLIGNAIAEYNSALQIYEKNSENRKALKVLESLLALDPKNTAIRLRIAERCFSMGDEGKALEGFSALARDLKDNGDESGFNHVSARLQSLFPEQGGRMLAAMVESAEPEPITSEPVIEAPPAIQAPIPPPPQPAAAVAKGEIRPLEKQAAVAPPLPLRIEEVVELIEEIDELEELVEEPASSFQEWEEEIDLGDIGDLEDFEPGEPVAAAEPLQLEELAEIPELEELTELAELELEELDLELEIEPGVELELDLEEEPGAEPVSAQEEEETAAEFPTDTFDLAGELALFADELDFDLPQRDNGGAPFAADAAEMFMRSDLDLEDAESHYSLGLAYKEMGLYDEAIAEFAVASNSPARRIDSLLLQGVCYRDNGDLAMAGEILGAILLEPSISENELLSIKYELALCHQISGDTEIARRLFTEIVTLRPGFSDAASRLENL